MPDNTGLLSQFYITLDGADAPQELLRDLLTITVENSLHLPDVATLELYDPQLRWIDDARLAPGTTIEIAAKATTTERPLFSGEIVEIEPHFEPGTQRLLIRAFDRLHRLARGQRVRSFQNVTDEDIIKRVASEAGLQVKLGTMSQVYAYVFQNDETNLAFLQGRAATLGYLLYVLGTTLHCEPPDANAPKVEVEWGATLSEFSAHLTTLGQLDGVTARGWDPQARQEIVGQAKSGRTAPRVGQSPVAGELAHRAFKLEAQGLVADRPIRSQALADRLAQAAADRHEGSFIEAEGICVGNPAIVAGGSLQIGALGDRFSGVYFVTSSTHTYSSRSGYATHFGVSGLDPVTLLSVLAPHESAAPRMGLVIGVVTDNADPEGQGRVKVKFPWLTSDHTSDWARIVTLGGGKQRGIEFLPEVNDEVLVGFEMGDVHFPYVLGGLWNGQDAPPEKSDSVVSSSGKVRLRIIRSRTGHTITLDDDDGGGGITLQDSAGDTVRLDARAQTITLTDKHENKLLLDGSQNALSISVKGNLSLEAQGQVRIKGAEVTVDGDTGVNVKGATINLN